MKGENTMVTLRPFTYSDAKLLKKYTLKDHSIAEIKSFIELWNTHVLKGKYFEMFAVMDGNTTVGGASLHESSEGVANEGIEIFEPYYRQGYGYEAVKAVFDIAKNKGYKKVVAKVAKENIPSVALHTKLGMTKVGEYTTTGGEERFLFEIEL